MNTSSLFRLGAVLLAWIAAATLVTATTVVPPEFPTLVNESDYIVHARVKTVRCERRSDHSDPNIVTFVELEVLEVVAGHPPTAPVLRFLGGRIGDDELRVEGSPQFAVGDEDILFVRGNGRSLCPLYAMGHGRYRVASNHATGQSEVHLANGRPLAALAAISEPLHGESASASASVPATTHAAADTTASAEPTAMTATAFIAQIRAAVRPGSRVTQARVE